MAVCTPAWHTTPPRTTSRPMHRRRDCQRADCTVTYRQVSVRWVSEEERRMGKREGKRKKERGEYNEEMWGKSECDAKSDMVSIRLKGPQIWALRHSPQKHKQTTHKPRTNHTQTPHTTHMRINTHTHTSGLTPGLHICANPKSINLI